MPIGVSEELEELMDPLFQALPVDAAMPNLLPRSKAPETVYKLAEAIEPNLRSDELKAALWLYVDDIDRSHKICQDIPNHMGSYLHAIVHRREGDFGNSKYWFRQAGHCPISISGYDPVRLVDAVSAARGNDIASLVELQRKEWVEVFKFCANSLEEEK
jgi:hypothetical protein